MRLWKGEPPVAVMRPIVAGAGPDPGIVLARAPSPGPEAVDLPSARVDAPDLRSAAPGSTLG